MDSRWRARARCLGTDPSGWDTEVATAGELVANRLLCQRCPVIADCARDALDSHAEAVLRAGVRCEYRPRAARLATEGHLLDVIARTTGG